MKEEGGNSWARSLFHISSGLAVVLVYGLTNITRNWTLIILGIIGLFFVLGDISRQFIPVVNRLTNRVFKPLMRQQEKTKLAASSYYVVGCWLSTLTFTRMVACVCILFLVIGDTVAKTLRQIFKEKKLSHQTLKAVSVNLLVSFLIVWLLLKAADVANPALPSFLGALGASIGEAVPKIDNLTIPMFSGILLTVGFYLVR